MSKEISSSTPHQKGPVYEYIPLHRPNKQTNPVALSIHRIIFTGKTTIGANEKERNSIFSQIWSNEKEKLKGRTIFEIYGIQEDGSYTYKFKTQEEIHHGSISKEMLNKPELPFDSTWHKVNKLTLTDFKQAEPTTGILDALEALVEFLATPFVMLYKYFVGGETKDFAHMLAPIKPECVGEVDHDAVLSQLHFMNHLFEEQDNAKHDKIENEPKKDINGDYEVNVYSQEDQTIFPTRGKLIKENDIEKVCVWTGGNRETWEPGNDTKHHIVSLGTASQPIGSFPGVGVEEKNHGRPTAVPLTHFSDKLYNPVIFTYHSDDPFLIEYKDRLEQRKKLTQSQLSSTKKQILNLTRKINEYKDQTIADDKNILLSKGSKKNYAAEIKEYEERIQSLKRKLKLQKRYITQIDLDIQSLSNVKHYYQRIGDGNKWTEINAEDLPGIKDPTFMRKIGNQGWERVLAVDDEFQNAESEEHNKVAFLTGKTAERWEKLKTGLCSFKATVEVTFSFAEWITPPKAALNELKDNIKKQQQALIKTLEAQEEKESEKKSSNTIQSATQKAASVFKEGYELGKAMYAAHNSGRGTKEIIEKVSKKIQNLESGQPFLLPLAQGEGKNYVPHFLLFVQNGQGRLVKHICFPPNSQERGKFNVLKTYQINDLTHDNEIVRPGRLFGENVEFIEGTTTEFVRALFNRQPFRRDKDAEDVLHKPSMGLEDEIDRLLLSYNCVLISSPPLERKASRDPVKALFDVIGEMEIKENLHLGLEYQKFNNIITSKGHFYQAYVNHLIAYYKKNESLMSSSERIQAIEGIGRYAGVASRYLQEEIGVQAAKEISQSLIEFVEAKLSELKIREELENQDISNLTNSKASPFKATLNKDFNSILKPEFAVRELPSHRITPDEGEKIERLKKLLLKPRSRKMKEELLGDLNLLLDRCEGYMKNKEKIIAKILSVGILQALPLPPNDTQDYKSFWNTLGPKEIDGWVTALSRLADRVFESSLSSGGYPLAPHEIVEFHTGLYLIQMSLFEKKLIYKQEEFKITFTATLADPSAHARMQPVLTRFTALCEEEIEKKVTAELKKKWAGLDKAERERQRECALEMSKYQARHQQWNARSDQYKEVFLWTEKAPDPFVPDFPTPQLKDQARKTEKITEFDKAKNIDTFLGQLRDLAAPLIALREKEIEDEVTEELIVQWKEQDDAEIEREKICTSKSIQYVPLYPSEDEKKKARESEKKNEIKASIGSDEFCSHFSNLQHLVLPLKNKNLLIELENVCQNSFTLHRRTVAVMGQILREIKISKELLAYKEGLAWLGEFDFEHGDNYWLFNRDKSVLTGLDPVLEEQRLLYKEILERARPGNLQKEQMACLLLGYDNEGDGTEIPKYIFTVDKIFPIPISVPNPFINRFPSKVAFMQEGYFKTKEEGYSFLTPKEMADLRKLDKMRDVLEYSEQVLEEYYGNRASHGIANALGIIDRPSKKELREEFGSMDRIYFVPAEYKGMPPIMTGRGCFSLSTNPTGAGYYSTSYSHRPEPKAVNRLGYTAHLDTELKEERVLSKDGERRLVQDVHNNALHSNDGIQGQIIPESLEVSLAATALANIHNLYNLSYISVIESIKFINLHYEELLIPVVRDILYRNLFQQGLIQQLIQSDPDFITRENGGGSALKRVVLWYSQQKNVEYKVCQFLVLEISDRIRMHAVDLAKNGLIDEDQADRISEALPKYTCDKNLTNKDVISGEFQRQLDQLGQTPKVFAQYLLDCYVTHPKIETLRELGDIIDILYAFYILQKSTFDVTHSGIEAKVLQNVRAVLLPEIAHRIKTNSDLRKKLLDRLSGKEGDWKIDQEKPYRYFVESARVDQPIVVDFLTGEGFCLKVTDATVSTLPNEIRATTTKDGNELTDFGFLFQDVGDGSGGEYDPSVVRKECEDGIIEYSWRDKKLEASFVIVARSQQVVDRIEWSHQIYQEQQENGIAKRYQFNRITFSKSLWTDVNKFFSTHHSAQMEHLITKKGVWVEVGASGELDISKVFVAQHGFSLSNDPIRLYIRGDTITGASLGKKKDKKWICPGLVDEEAPFLSFSRGKDLLFLSKNGSSIDEIRFPQIPGKQEQLILKKKEGALDVWVVDGKEHLQWQLTDTRDFEKRFGKNWREYVLPLKNITNSGMKEEEQYEFWIFPYLAKGFGKHGFEEKFLKTPRDFINFAAEVLPEGALDAFLQVPELQVVLGSAMKGMTTNDLRNLTGSFAAIIMPLLAKTLKLMRHGQSEQEKKIEGFMEICELFINPQPFCYKIEHRSEQSTDAGFFYLAHLAILRHDWATAVNYLTKMTTSGHSDAESLKQLQVHLAFDLVKHIKPILDSFMSLQKGNSKEALQVFTSSSPLESAFCIKLILALIAVSERLKAKDELNLFGFLEESITEAVEQIPHLKGQGTSSILIAIAGVFYQDYIKALPTHQQKLKDHSLLLTKKEEMQIGENPLALLFGMAVGGGGEATDQLITMFTQNNPLPMLSLPKEGSKNSITLEIPTLNEIEEMVEAIAINVNPTGVYTIHGLHETYGSYPKTETVLAHFWTYWDWIYFSNDLQIEEISFLFVKPPEEKNFKQVDIARRLLLTLFHIKRKDQYKEFRNGLGITPEITLEAVQKARATLPNYHAMNMLQEEFTDQLEKNASFWGTLWNIAQYFSMRQKVTLEQLLHNLTYTQQIGGEPESRGVLKNFKDPSNQLIISYISNAIEDLGVQPVIFINRLLPKLHPVETIISKKSQVNSLPKMDRISEAKERAFKKFINEIALINKLITMALPNEGGEIVAVERLESFKPYIMLALDLPNIEAILDTVMSYLTKEVQFLQGKKATLRTIKETLHNILSKIYGPYLKEAGLEGVNNVVYEVPSVYSDVRVTRPPKQIIWEDAFCPISNKKYWDDRKALAYEKSSPKEGATSQEIKVFEANQKEIDVADTKLRERTAKTLRADQLTSIFESLCDQLEKRLIPQKKQLEKEILDFIAFYAEALHLSHLFSSDDGRISIKQKLNAIFDLYRRGQFALLGSSKEAKLLDQEISEKITKYLLIRTEIQQYRNAQDLCKVLLTELKRIDLTVDSKLKGEPRWIVWQEEAERSKQWLLKSSLLHSILITGSDHLRYNERDKQGMVVSDMLRDQQFTRLYLVNEVENLWISRPRATQAIELMLQDLKEGEAKKAPVRFLKVPMGTGKSDVIIPADVELLMQHGLDPVIITSTNLIAQMMESLNHRPFIFTFDHNFGLEQEIDKDGNKIDLTNEKIIAHLESIVTVLNSLKREKRYVLTAPFDRAFLYDKRIELADILKQKDDPENAKECVMIFRQLQLLKKIENYFYSDTIVQLLDEDTNFAVDFDFHLATGDFETVNSVRLTMLEKIFDTMERKFPVLWKHFVNHDLRALPDGPDTLRGLVAAIFDDLPFWTSPNIGWSKEEWLKINRLEFIDYILGQRGQNLPTGMKPLESETSELEAIGRQYVAAMKSYLAEKKTLDNVKSVNPQQERGLKNPDGEAIVAVPYHDAKEQEGVVYGDESETILHQFCHYLGINCNIAKKKFKEIYHKLSGSSREITPNVHKETWQNWAQEISKHCDGREPYDAFNSDPRLARQRMQFLRYILTDCDFVRIYKEKITCNSQDIGLGVGMEGGSDSRLLSGTGDEFSLGLDDYRVEALTTDYVLGETLLLLDLNKPINTFVNPLEHVKNKSCDPKCVAILNFDYEIFGNNTQVLVTEIRHDQVRREVEHEKEHKEKIEIARPIMYRHYNEGELEKRLWMTGSAARPMKLEKSAVTPKTFTYMGRDSTRGCDFPMPITADGVADAMVGMGNKIEDILQLLWRCRQLGAGQDITISMDVKTEKHIRELCGIPSDKPVTIGDAMHYFVLNALKDNEIKRIKECIFKAQTPLKLEINREVRQIYDLSDIQDPFGLCTLESTIVFDAARGLYITSSKIDWATEFQVQKKVGPLAFMESVFEEELEKLKNMESTFDANMNTFVKGGVYANKKVPRKGGLAKVLGLFKGKDVKPVAKEEEKLPIQEPNPYAAAVGKHSTLMVCDGCIKQKTTQEQFEKRLMEHLKLMKGTSQEIAYAREIARKYYGIKKGFVDARVNIETRLKELEIIDGSVTKKIAELKVAQKLVNSKDTLTLMKINAQIRDLEAIIKGIDKSDVGITGKIESLNKTLNTLSENDARREKINGQIEGLKNLQKYKEYLEGHLPPEISLDAGGGGGSQQKTNQCQKQKVKHNERVKNQTTEPANRNTSTTAIKLDDLLGVQYKKYSNEHLRIYGDVIEVKNNDYSSKKNTSYKYSSNYNFEKKSYDSSKLDNEPFWSKAGNYLPLHLVIDIQFGIDEGSYQKLVPVSTTFFAQNLCISRRACELFLEMRGTRAECLFEILMIQENNGPIRGVLITPDEHNERIAADLTVQKTINDNRTSIALYSLSDGTLRSMVLGETQQIQEMNNDFLHLMVMTKLFIGYTNLSIEELSYLTWLVNGDDPLEANSLIEEYQGLPNPDYDRLCTFFKNKSVKLQSSLALVEKIREGTGEWVLEVAERKLLEIARIDMYRLEELNALDEKWGGKVFAHDLLILEGKIKEQFKNCNYNGKWKENDRNYSLMILEGLRARKK